MKEHPKHEDWIPYLYGESEAAEQRRLTSHLSECAECAQLVNNWKGTMKSLDAWQIPARSPGIARWRIPVQLAAAACILLVAGFGIGKATTPAVDEAHIQKLVAKAIEHERPRFFKEFVVALEVARAEDRSSTELLLSSLRDEQHQRLVELRKDLETVATSTDAEIRDARLGLLQLAAYTQPVE